MSPVENVDLTTVNKSYVSAVLKMKRLFTFTLR